MKKYFISILLAVCIHFQITSCKNEKKLKHGLKSVMMLCNVEQVKIMRIFLKMEGKDSVFKYLPIQMRVNNNLSYQCERGYFQQPVISCQVIDCDGNTKAILFYENRSNVESENEIKVLKNK